MISGHIPGSPSRIPGQGPKGRRSGAYSHRSGIKIACTDKRLRRAAGRVGPGSPLSLRPGMRCEMRSPSRAPLRPGTRCEMVRSVPDPRARRDPSAHPIITRGASYDLWVHPKIPPVASPDKAREGRRSGAHSPRGSVKIAFHNKCLRRVASRVGPGSPLSLRPGMRCEIGSPSRTPLRPGMRCEMVRSQADPRARRDFPAHPMISGRIPRSPGAHPRISGCIPRSPRSHPRTRPAGPPIRGPLASQQHQDRA